MDASFLSSEGKVALITGGSRGIGRSTALAFADAGADVVIAARKLPDLEAVAAEIKQMGRKALVVETHAKKSEDLKNLVDETMAEFGRIDILINNASKIIMCPALEMTTETYEEIMLNNATSMVMFSREAGRQMVKQGNGGVMVFLSSIHAAISEPNCSAYTAAKGAIEAYGRTLATELAPHKIRVNMIQPGATYSELTTPMYTEPVKRSLFERVPMKEIAQPEWIARGIVFLASGESRYMTGETLVMDGGYRMDGSLPGAAYWEE